MTDPISNRVAHILYTSDRIVMPLQELYQSLAMEGWLTQIDAHMFEYLLAADSRFELLEGLNDTVLINSAFLTQFDIRDMFAGPLVMLRRVAASADVVLLDVLRYLQEMNRALEHAWRGRVARDSEIENDILSLLMLGDMLERQLKRSLRLDPFTPLEEVERLAFNSSVYNRMDAKKS